MYRFSRRWTPYTDRHASQAALCAIRNAPPPPSPPSRTSHHTPRDACSRTYTPLYSCTLEEEGGRGPAVVTHPPPPAPPPAPPPPPPLANGVADFCPPLRKQKKNIETTLQTATNHL